MNNNKTCLTRLHEVLLGRLNGRGCGETYARCHILAGMVEIGEKNITCLITQIRDVQYLIPMIMHIFEEHGIEIEKIKYNTIIYTENSRIVFVVDDGSIRSGFNNNTVIYIKH